jgi:hypothetical protein
MTPVDTLKSFCLHHPSQNNNRNNPNHRRIRHQGYDTYSYPVSPPTTVIIENNTNSNFYEKVRDAQVQESISLCI